MCLSHLVDLVLEAQDLGQCVQHVNGEAFIPLGLPQDVFGNHDERILLQKGRETHGQDVMSSAWTKTLAFEGKTSQGQSKLQRDNCERNLEWSNAQ